MSDQSSTAVKQALITIKKLQARLDAEVRERTEPIAIIGMACRFPGGADTPEAFWQLLEQQRDAVTEIPAERHGLRPLKDGSDDAEQRASRWGAFLKDVDLFDAQFFGISPREAKSMDPQQRLLLEVSWEALERAGQTREGLMGARAGVFVGMVWNDYEEVCRSGDLAHDMYTMTGNGHCFPPGRLSYVLGLEGPSMAVDTACSSSLVAVHLACQSLRARESTLALAGGVNLMLSPSATRWLVSSQALSPDGRSRTFDARANGFVRGEGCGMLVLKRLSDALADGDPVLAVIRGSAVNQDGRSSGLTAPNVLAQKELLRQALEHARVSASEIGYVETHGTGTPLGDPIELTALSEVIGRPRDDGSTCVLGAVKTNIAHLEAAAGVAGVIKAVLALQHEVIPPNLHFKTLNPRITLEGTSFVIPTESVPFKAGPKPRRVGVSSFGMSGTNAHAVLEEAPTAPLREPDTAAPLLVIPLSAQSPKALIALARATRTALSEQPPGEAWSLRDIAYTAAVRRTHHEHRLALVARSREEVSELLEAFERGEARPGLAQGRAKPERRPKIVLVFPGQGSQWVGMGRDLLAEEPAFRAAIEACDAAIAREAGWSLLDELGADEGRARLDQIDVIQPALFAMGVALAALWRSWGVAPDAVVGHSMGEIAAAHVAGALQLDDAVKIICRRSRLMRRLSGRGAMAVVELPLAEAKAALSGYEDRLSIAASNSPRSTVISGETRALDEVLATLSRREIFCRRIKVDVASHSPEVEPLRGELLEALRDVAPRRAEVAMCSTVTGEICDGAALDAAYWVQNLRAPVLFSRAVEALLASDHALFVEMSPHPILLPAIEETMRKGERDGAALPSMRRDKEARRVMLESLGAIHAHGHAVDWRRFHPSGGRCVPLPTYPWQRERHWVEADTRTSASPRPARGGASGHPLLGAAFTVSIQPEARFWERDLGPRAPTYLADHRVDGEVVLPATAYLEMALAAAAEAYGAAPCALEEVSFERMLALPEASARTVQVVLRDEQADRASFQIFSRTDADPTWIQHAAGRVRIGDGAAATTPPGDAPRGVEARCPLSISAADHYQRMAARAIAYGPTFQGVERLCVGTDEVLGRVRVPDEVALQASAYQVHPALLDACFQVLAGLFLAQDGVLAGDEAFVPVSLESVRVHRRPGRELWVHGRLRAAAGDGAETPTGELLLLDDDGRVLLEAKGLCVKRLSPRALVRRDAHEAWLYALEWRRQDLVARPSAPSPATGAWVVLIDRGGTGAALCASLRRRGEACVAVVAGERYARIEPDLYEIDPADPHGFRALLHDALGKEMPCRGVVHLWSLDATPAEATTAATLDADLRLGSLSALAMAQALLQRRWRDTPRLWLVTRGALPTEVDTAHLSLSQTPLWGFGRTLAMEHPELGCRRIDLSPAWSPERAATALLDELAATDGEDQIALREHGRLVARLQRSAFGASAPLAPKVRADGTYLITGGLGGLGIRLAQWLVAEGARHLVLLGRSEASQSARDAITAMRAAGAEVSALQVDVSQRAELDRAFAAIEERMPPLRGIVHAAMVLDDRTVMELDAERFRKVMAPKVAGAWNLHELTRERPLDFFVLYSSFAALLGPPGQSNYAAANEFLGALAHHRRGLGLPGLTIEWGRFSEAGTVAARQDISDRLSLRGIDNYTPAEGLAVLGRLLGSATTQIAVLKLNLRQWLEFYPSAAGVPVFSELKREQWPARSEAPHAGRLRETLEKAAPGERQAILEEHLAEHLGRIIHLDASRIDRAAPFTSLGVDSLMALEMRNRLEASLSLKLSATLLFAYPTITALAEHLISKLPLPGGEPPAKDEAPSRGHGAAIEQLSADEILALIDGSLDRMGRPDHTPRERFNNGHAGGRGQ